VVRGRCGEKALWWWCCGEKALWWWRCVGGVVVKWSAVVRERSSSSSCQDIKVLKLGPPPRF